MTILASSGPPTYGELLNASLHTAELARHHGCGPFTGPQQACDAVNGYERFLGVLGRHLELVAAPGHAHVRHGSGPPLRALPELLHRLTRHDITHPTREVWGRAADRLGIAHDLLATHIGTVTPSPQAHLLADEELRSDATRRLLTEAAAPSVSAGGILLLNAVHARGRTGPRPTKSQTANLRHTSQTAPPLIADLLTEHPPHRRGNLSALDGLAPATPTVSTDALTRPGFESSIAALKVLQLISYRQTTGDELASTGSLRDLAQIAVAVTIQIEHRLPSPATGLDRVRRAATVDSLHQAKACWQTAADAIGHNVRALQRAPRANAEAIRHLGQHCPNNDGLRRAVLAALPRLGTEAAVTISKLTNAETLVIATRQPCHYTAIWRPLTHDEGDHLAAVFQTAGTASQIANDQLKPLTAQPGPRQRRTGAGSLTTERGWGYRIEGLSR